MTKILLFNIPAGPITSDYPPVAISRVMEGIDQSLDCDVSFYDIDYLRPAFDEIKNKIQSYSPHIIGFSAMLTPSYAYLKKLSNFIGENFPEIIQVLGGQMAVISNIILLKTKVDFCCIGESEPIFSNLIKKLQEDNFKPGDMEEYAVIKGIVFLKDNIPYFTGYESENIQNGLRQFNYKLISKFTNIDNYIHKVDGQYFKVRVIGTELDCFLNLIYPENRSKYLTTVFASKGCVNRCSFCHRFYKGYRVIAEEDVINHIENLKRDCNMGMILFSEENFGAHKESTYRLTEYLKTSGLNWAPTAVRVRNINEEIIKTWKESGCAHIIFGIESLSQKMLDVMEKNSTVEENLNAVRLCHKYKIFTVVALVIGMPGETEETVEETIKNLSSLVPDDINFPFDICSNFVQAIPGTLVYEYAKKMGFIGESLEGEEEYIESLYDVNAGYIKHYLNFTDYEKEEIAYWIYYISLELAVAYIKKHGYINIYKNKKTRTYRIGLIYILFPKRIRKFLLKYSVIIKSFGLTGLAKVICRKVMVKKEKRFRNVDTSLRKVLQEFPERLREDEKFTAVFRMGY